MLGESIASAIERRRDLLAQLAAEGTDCVRLFHGVVEGQPGLAIDRYGPVLLTQSWGAPIEPAMQDTIARVVRDALAIDLAAAFVERGRQGARVGSDPRLADALGHELGLAYDVRPFHAGQDPLLFLDLRVLRRLVKASARGHSVLNLFAYTCGLGVAAAADGAREVVNVDFAASALAIGRANAERNGIGDGVFRTLEENAIPILRQLADLPVKGRGHRRPFQRVAARTFDLVLLDPPRWAKTPFGAIDVERDYPSLLRPAIRCVAPGGRLAATCHVPTMTRDVFEHVVRRSAEKETRTIAELTWLVPDADFPSPDAQPPLKIAVARLA
jgi:23S rRNA (cytosine1962-C5)-methyltransferase